MGMVGGGRGALNGKAHRIAAQFDGKVDLVCGAFSSTKQRSRDSGRDLFLPADRIYGTYREMFRKEPRRAENDRMDFVAVVTPNNMHYPVAMAALDAGFHVICDRPMTMTLDEAKNLARKVKMAKRMFCVTHNYTGYPMIREARRLVTKGRLGNVRRVVAEYPQGWLAARLETMGDKQAAWRTDPKRAGSTCCMGDIGSQAACVAEYITGSQISEVCANLTTWIKGRPLDDDASVLIRFRDGAQGVIWASQIAIGEESGLTIRIYGEDGSLVWQEDQPNTLVVHWNAKASEIRRARTGAATRDTVPAAGTAEYPKGYLESLANIYSAFIDTVAREIDGKKGKKDGCDFPTVEDGIHNMAFLKAVVRSSRSKEKWIKVPK